MILTAHFCSKPKRLFGRAGHPIIRFCIIKASTRDESCFHFTAALWTEMCVHTQNFVLSDCPIKEASSPPDETRHNELDAPDSSILHSGNSYARICSRKRLNLLERERGND